MCSWDQRIRLTALHSCTQDLRVSDLSVLPIWLAWDLRVSVKSHAFHVLLFANSANKRECHLFVLPIWLAWVKASFEFSSFADVASTSTRDSPLQLFGLLG